jgi:hypothetical protein
MASILNDGSVVSASLPLGCQFHYPNVNGHHRLARSAIH